MIPGSLAGVGNGLHRRTKKNDWVMNNKYMGKYMNELLLMKSWVQKHKFFLEAF